MSWRNFLAFCLFFVFLGCFSPNTPYFFKNENDNNFLILEALINELHGTNKDKIFANYHTLYRKTNDKIYLINALKYAFEYDQKIAFKLCDEAIEKYPNSDEVRRFYIKKLIIENKFHQALIEANKLIFHDKMKDFKTTNSSQLASNFALLGSIYFKLNNPQEALKNFKISYKINPNELVLLKISELLESQNPLEAIRELEGFIRLQNASLAVYYKLLYLYGKNLNYDGLFKTYKILYETFKDTKYAINASEVLYAQKKFTQAIGFLEQNNIEDDILLNLYLQTKAYDKAKNLANKLWIKTKNVDYLIAYTINFYESAKTNLSKIKIQKIIENFEFLLKHSQDAMILNYYGYILIEHDIDYQKGINLVKDALKSDSNNIYYLDSLAWGYYKIQKCDLAYGLLKDIVNQTDENDIKTHFQLIKKCIKNIKK